MSKYQTFERTSQIKTQEEEEKRISYIIKYYFFSKRKKNNKNQIMSDYCTHSESMKYNFTVAICAVLIF